MITTGNWEYKSSVGAFRIVQREEGFQLLFEDEALGYYHDPLFALDDLVGGFCTWPSIGDPSKLRIPDDLKEWHRL